MSEKKIFYYTDEVNEDFSGIVRDRYHVDSSYKYIHTNPIYRFFTFIVYRIIMTPVAWLHLKIKFNTKFVNKSCIKEISNRDGYFLFGNHSNIPADGYIPTMICSPSRRSYDIVSAENMAIKGTRTFMKMVGALPLPDGFKSMKNFMKAIQQKIDEGQVITIYPEAHIWPYYTKIRNYKSDSFRFPCKHNSASFCFTTTYQKRKIIKRPRIVVYVDGPFYPNKDLNGSEQKQELRDRIYKTMVERSKNSNCEYYIYRKKEN